MIDSDSWRSGNTQLMRGLSSTIDSFGSFLEFGNSSRQPLGFVIYERFQEPLVSFSLI